MSSLTVNKTIAGDDAEAERAFRFTITLSDKSVNGEYGSVIFENGVAVVDIPEFDKEGINKIVSMVNGDVKDLQTRVEKLQDLANEYDSFAGKDEEAEGTTKFIFVVDSLKKDSKKEESNMPVENSTSTANSENDKETSSGK